MRLMRRVLLNCRKSMRHKKEGQGLCPWPPLGTSPQTPLFRRLLKQMGVWGLRPRHANACSARRVQGSALAFLVLTGCQNSPPAPVPIKGPVIPTSPGEKLVYLVPVHWHSAHVVQSIQVDSIEYVPPGQTRQQWTDMVTAVWIQRPIYHTLAGASAAMRATITKRCAVPPVFSPLQYTIGQEYDATTETIRCGRTPENFAHIAIIKTIKSDNGYYQLQRAWRQPAAADSYTITVSDAEMKAAGAVLAAFHLEHTKSDQPPAPIAAPRGASP
jgi:hypothetical protein